MYYVLMISIPAPAVEVAVDVDAVAESNPPNARYGNMLSIVTPLRLNAKPRAVSSKGGHVAFCIRRELAAGFVHSGLSSNDKILGTAGRVRACGSRVGQLIERGQGETADPTVYTFLLLLLLMLRSTIEREAGWDVGVTCLSGGRESGKDACRSIRRWESSEGSERRAELHEGLLLFSRFVGRLVRVGTGQGVHERFFGPAFALVVEIYISFSLKTLSE